VPAGDQPWYVNAVVAVETPLDPAALLGVLHAIEADLGRVRGVPNAARSCDLDLLDYDSRISAGGGAESGPVLPHPRLSERLFVLRPLAEVAPGWVHPVSGRTVEALIAAAPGGQQCRPLGECRTGS
jgi:2-amino-4-hydroxy-6-hydroxymethyldihydropteridine diphosphokinase